MKTIPFNGIPFPNDETRNRAKVDEVFAEYGMKVEDLQTQYFMWVYVLVSDGSLWLLDKSHGGGGVFKLDKK